MAVVSVEMGFASKLTEEVAGPFGSANVLDYSMPDILLRGGPVATTSVPIVTQVWSGTLALTAGALTIDLQSLARTGRTALDLTGLRVFGYRIDNTSDAALTFLAPVADDYPMVPATPGLVVGAGASVQMFDRAGFGTVGATASDISVTGAGTETFRLSLFAGPV